MSALLVAQHNVDFFNDTLQRKSIATSASFFYGSNSINIEMVNKFIYGGKIENELKDKVSDNLKNNNNVGADLNISVLAEIPFDTLFNYPNISLVFGLENVEHFDANFTEDLFNFAFYGNKRFAGKTIDIGGTSFNSFKYQKLDFGFIHYNKKAGKMLKEGVVMALIKAEESLAITVPTGSIFTEEFGRAIDLELNYQYNASDTANKGFFATNGVGISTKMFTEHLFNNGDKLHVEVADVGFIYWNNNSIEKGTDSTYTYEGVVVDDIFNMSDTLLSRISEDSLTNSLTTSNKNQDYSVALPISFNVNYTKYFSNKLKINAGVYYKMLSNYFPQFYTNTYYSFNELLVARLHLSYGGYGQFNTGLALAKSFSKKLDVYIGTNNIEAFIVPNSSYANSGFVGLKMYF